MIASAPGKVILFGEHAVVYGEPAIAAAISLRTYVSLSRSSHLTINGHVPEEGRHRYVLKALEVSGAPRGLEIITRSSIPPASGLGSSASVSVATVAASLALRKGNFEPEEVARLGFEVEHSVQGRASPTDTSTATHGHAILVDRVERRNLLWRIARGESVWYMHHIEVPDLTLVVGYSGIRSSTAEMVAKVRRFVEWSSFARDVIREIGRITLAAIKPLEDGDCKKLGELMLRNNRCLTILGVGHPTLSRMMEAAMKHSYGAKITGAGGGGSIIALTDSPEETKRAIEDVGGKAYMVKLGGEGVMLH